MMTSGSGQALDLESDSAKNILFTGRFGGESDDLFSYSGFFTGQDFAFFSFFALNSRPPAPFVVPPQLLSLENGILMTVNTFGWVENVLSL